MISVFVSMCMVQPVTKMARVYSGFKNVYATFTRRKTIESTFESPLRRCLVFWDLFLLGVGGSVDVALYILLGNVIREFSGPSIIISMVFGFFVCFISGLCYAEFGSVCTKLK